MRTAILLPFLLLAGAGLVLSAVAHGFALLGKPQPLGDDLFWMLHVGIFVVWIPALLAANRLQNAGPKDDPPSVPLRCPGWVGGLIVLMYGYCAVTLVICKVLGESGGRGNPPPLTYRGFSAGWMVFYALGMWILYSVVAALNGRPVRRCPNGHRVGAADACCGACGATVLESGRAAEGGQPIT